MIKYTKKKKQFVNIIHVNTAKGFTLLATVRSQLNYGIPIRGGGKWTVVDKRKGGNTLTIQF